jgi:hypothetical protein
MRPRPAGPYASALARTVREGWAIYHRLPEDPRGDQIIMLLQRASALMAAVEDVLGSLCLAPEADLSAVSDLDRLS